MKGGGVLLAINNKLVCKQLPTPEYIEALAVTISGIKSLTVAVIYIPPNSPDTHHSSVLNFIHLLPQVEDLMTSITPILTGIHFLAIIYTHSLFVT